jgi:hypothetical protein
MVSCNKTVLFLFLACTCSLAMAQSDHSMQLPETEAIAEQRIALAEEKKSSWNNFKQHLRLVGSNLRSTIVCSKPSNKSTKPYRPWINVRWL